MQCQEKQRFSWQYCHVFRKMHLKENQEEGRMDLKGVKSKGNSEERTHFMRNIYTRNIAC